MHNSSLIIVIVNGRIFVYISLIFYNLFSNICCANTCCSMDKYNAEYCLLETS